MTTLQNRLRAGFTSRERMEAADRIDELEAQVAVLKSLLPDDLYAGSKDWLAGDLAERVQWLKSMYESAKGERDMCLEGVAALTKDADRYRWLHDALRAAAQAVIDRWETPLWKDVPATAEYIYKLRDALTPAP